MHVLLNILHQHFQAHQCLSSMIHIFCNIGLFCYAMLLPKFNYAFIYVIKCLHTINIILRRHVSGDTSMFYMNFCHCEETIRVTTCHNDIILSNSKQLFESFLDEFTCTDIAELSCSSDALRNCSTIDW